MLTMKDSVANQVEQHVKLYKSHQSEIHVVVDVYSMY